jgi:hypothetical protein
MEIGTDENPQHWHEEIGEDVGNRLNWLRAGSSGPTTASSRSQAS